VVEQKLATFKINGDRWDAFLVKASEQGASASSVLKAFIDRCLDGQMDIESVQPANLELLLQQKLNQALAIHLEPARVELAALRDKVTAMEQQLGLDRRISALEASLQQNSKQVHTPEPITISRPPVGIQPKLTIDAAWQIARSRGYPSEASAFRDWSARNPDKCQSQYGLMRFSASRGMRNQFMFADLWGDRIDGSSPAI
jgi:hypothetical protein